MAYSWFLRTNPSNDPTLPASYESAIGIPSCAGTNKVCAIYAEVDESTGLPILGFWIDIWIKITLDSKTHTPYVKLADF